MNMNMILSFGGGVNSMALLCLKIKKKIDFDVVVFADTGAEIPETYSYIQEIVKPLCVKEQIPFYVTGSKNMYEEYYEKKIIPCITHRHCTDKYKIRPMKKWSKERYGNDYITLIGIDYGEKKRARKKRYGFEYPLVDLKIDRNGCKNIIKDCGFPVPVKSGCFFCPFMKISNWKGLYKNYKDLFLKAEKLEQNCSSYPKYSLTRIKLEQLRKAIETQTKLSNY